MGVLAKEREWGLFDEVISSLDPQLFRSPEEAFLPADFLRDPFTPLEEIRDRFGRVVDRAAAMAAGYLVPNSHLVDESKPIFLVLGYDEAVAVLRDPTVSNSGYRGGIEQVFGQSLTMLDGAEHERVRTLLLQAFKRAAIARWVTELIGPAAEHLVDRLALRDSADLVLELAAPLPFAVMARMMGLAEADFGRFVKMATDLLYVGYDFEAALAARDQVTAYFQKEIEDRRARPRDDLVSMLVHAEVDGERLSDEEILSNLRQLLPAGIETTYRTTSNMWLCLLKDRPQYEAVVADPAIVPAAVEEGLRFEGPATAVPRIATRDMEVGGARIPAGSGMLVFQAIANRDPRRWSEPDRFDVRRPAQPHIAFIAGPHTCVGFHLARAQMQKSLEAVARRLPDLELAVPADEVASVGFVLRAPASCPVRTHASS